MKLEDQLATLADLGLTLNDGISVDDLLYSFDRSEFESKPFELILFALGIEVEREPWGRFVSDRAWNFDTECIEGDGAYVRIVDNLCRVAGARGLLSDVRDHVDLQSGEAWLEYTCDGNKRRWKVEVNDDWADSMTVSYVMDDIERDGKRFYYKDNGQAMVVYYLDEGAAARLRELSPEPIEPVV
jgi:hypothetical protein